MNLGPTHLRLAVADCLRDHRPNARQLDSILARLWREPVADVTNAHAAMLAGLDAMSCDDAYGEVADGWGRVGILAARMRCLRRPLPRREKHGLRISEAAKALHMDRETLVRLMVRNGILELVPFGRHQSRRLVTDRAYHDELGHNVDPEAMHSPVLSGHARSSVFPVIYADQLGLIEAQLGWTDIQKAAASIRDKRARMCWLLLEQADLPDETLALLGGYSLRGVKKARAVRRRG